MKIWNPFRRSDPAPSKASPEEWDIDDINLLLRRIEDGTDLQVEAAVEEALKERPLVRVSGEVANVRNTWSNASFTLVCRNVLSATGNFLLMADLRVQDRAALVKIQKGSTLGVLGYLSDLTLGYMVLEEAEYFDP